MRRYTYATTLELFASLLLVLTALALASAVPGPLLAADIDGDCVNKPSYNHPSTVTRGVSITIAGVPTYYVALFNGSTHGAKRANKNKAERVKVVLWLSDVYGPWNVSNMLVQDAFADAGFHVLGIDYFFGDSGDKHGFKDLAEQRAWSDGWHACAREVLPVWVKGVNDIYGPDAKYTAVGYCFGAQYAMELGATDEVVAAAFAHPSRLTEGHFANLTKPLLLSCAEYDGAFPPPNLSRTAEVLAETKKQYYIQVFSGVRHGFATRADPADFNAVWAKDKALMSMVEWFERLSVDME
ncbi:alpha/beta-hydrolase [Coprinopsis marcescibilis]|uniref:Alpha/beta-hydrolase n=1 Tax=Coprinopsis marcescibilis TaxID=230819 RepID=A0A5C3KL30_COPMA|nr:alpha/beta-hydrolase [Coprinopsis marcescibilis]